MRGFLSVGKSFLFSSIKKSTIGTNQVAKQMQFKVQFNLVSSMLNQQFRICSSLNTLRIANLFDSDLLVSSANKDVEQGDEETDIIARKRTATSIVHGSINMTR